MKNNEIKTSLSVFGNGNNDKLLTVTKSATVQPVALMRLGVFVPKPGRTKGLSASSIDATADFSQLEIARAEGYDSIKISGPRLDMEIDFKVWVGVIYAFSKYGIDTNTIELGYIEFAKMCGFSTDRLGRKLKNDIQESLFRIRNKGILFTKKATNRTYFTGLLKSGDLNPENDKIILEADPNLWELYQFDHQVLLQLKIIKKLSQKETAQAVYTFIESLPSNPIPLSFSRLRERLMLKSEIKGQNRAIKTAIEHLKKIGYLNGEIKKKGNENYLLIYNTNPKLLDAI